MPKEKEACARCKQTVDADTLIQCPTCNDECCEDCIAGVGVDCFQCEEGGDVEDENTDEFGDDPDDFEEDDNDIEEDHG